MRRKIQFKPPEIMKKVFSTKFRGYNKEEVD
ncbi:DivIVA domain-containing protein [Streptococcus timonensis]